MPGTRCAVYGCSNTYKVNKGRKHGGSRIMMHWFPKSNDPVSQKIRSEWISRCGRQGHTFNPDTSRICSNHFVDIDYERDLPNELLGLPCRKILKKTAVPSVGIQIKVSQEPWAACDLDEGYFRKNIKQEVAEYISTESDTIFPESELSSVLQESLTPPRPGTPQTSLYNGLPSRKILRKLAIPAVEPTVIQIKVSQESGAACDLDDGNSRKKIKLEVVESEHISTESETLLPEFELSPILQETNPN